MATDSSDAELLLFTNYKSTLHKSFIDMFRKGELTDATLTCDGKRVRVHKFLLSSASAFFDNAFKKHEGDCNIPITDVTHDDLIKVLEYIYNGEVALEPSKVRAFVDAAKEFAITINDEEMQRVSGRLESTHNEIANTVKQNKSENAVAETKSDCIEENAASIELDKTETIRIKKPNSENERNRTQKKADKNAHSGIVVVSQAEFLERMFKLRNLEWPMDCDQEQPTNAVAPSLFGVIESSHPPPQPSTSNTKSGDKPKCTSQNGIKDDLPSARKLKKEIRRMNKGLKDNKRRHANEELIARKQEKLTQLREQFAKRCEQNRGKNDGFKYNGGI